MLRNVCGVGAALCCRSQSLTGGTGSMFYVSVRHHKPFRYPKVNYLPFEWDYPKRKNFIVESGDLSSDFGYSEKFLDAPKPPFDTIPEFETAPEKIKRIFCNRFTSDRAKIRTLQTEFVKYLQRHPFDKKSPESKIAHYTFHIRAMREFYNTKLGRNRRIKVSILEAVGRRHALLTFLAKCDNERYEYVKKMLEIEHTPPPIERLPKKLSRKGTLRDMTAEYADKMKQEKMQAYHEKLKDLQKEFEVEKRQAEEWIAKEIAELKLSDEEIKSLEYEGRIL